MKNQTKQAAPPPSFAPRKGENNCNSRRYLRIFLEAKIQHPDLQSKVHAEADNSSVPSLACLGSRSETPIR